MAADSPPPIIPFDPFRIDSIPRMATLLLLLLIAAPAGATVEVETLDGTTRQGIIESWQDDSLALRNDEGGEEIVPLDRVLRIAPVGTEPLSLAARDDAPLLVKLVDGSEFAVKEVESNDKTASLVAPQGLPDVGRLEVPIAAIHSVRRVIDASEPPDRASRLNAQWNDIAAMQAAGDLIVIRKAEADTLNYVAGAIGTIGKEKIGFTLDEQPIEVGRERVFGWIFYRPPQSDAVADARPVVRGNGFRLVADKVTWQAGKWFLTSPSLSTVALRGEMVESIDLSAGKVLYLSDLEPRRAEYTPPPTIALVGTLLEGYARDRGFFSSQLWLEYPPESLDESLATSAGVSRRVEFRKGLALRGKMELAYRLPGEFRQFRAVAGIDPQAKAAGPVVLRIVGDGKELLKQSIRGNEAPREISCSVEGVSQLELFVGFESQNPLDHASGGALHLGSARLTR